MKKNKYDDADFIYQSDDEELDTSISDPNWALVIALIVSASILFIVASCTHG